MKLDFDADGFSKDIVSPLRAPVRFVYAYTIIHHIKIILKQPFFEFFFFHFF